SFRSWEFSPGSPLLFMLAYSTLLPRVWAFLCRKISPGENHSSVLHSDPSISPQSIRHDGGCNPDPISPPHQESAVRYRHRGTACRPRSNSHYSNGRLPDPPLERLSLYHLLFL